MTLPRKIKKGDKLLIEAVATTDEDSLGIVSVKLFNDKGGWDRCSEHDQKSIWVESVKENLTPRPITVGDRVKSVPYETTGVVKAIEGDHFWVLVDGASSPYTYDNRNLKFEVI